MSITLDPTKPPDTGESPTLGASRIRNVSAFLLQVLGFTGTASQTLSVIPFSVNATSGIVSLAGNGTTGTEPVVYQQFTTGTAHGGTYFTIPGGLIVQLLLGVSVTNAELITLPTPFTSSSSYVVMATYTGAAAGGAAIYISAASSSTFNVNGILGTQTVSFLAVGS